jgi:hypothetical protein
MSEHGLGNSRTTAVLVEYNIAFFFDKLEHNCSVQHLNDNRTMIKYLGCLDDPVNSV